MARSFDQVLAEVTSRSDPQRQLVLGQISQLPTQQAADEASLDAKQDLAHEDILAGARRRGLGFAGIPLGEQAKYNATEYAPAVANLKTSYGGRKATLESALAGIGQNDYSTAYSMFNQDRAFDEQQRQFNESLSAQQKAAASQSNPFAGLFGGAGKAEAPPDSYANVDKQGATNAVKALLSTGNRDTINRTIAAITDSANRGNAYDRFKLELLDMYRKNSQYGSLFKNLSAPSTNKLPTGGISTADPLFNRLADR